MLSRLACFIFFTLYDCLESSRVDQLCTVKKKIYFGNCGNFIADNAKKKIYFGNCGNPIVDNVKK